MENLNQLKVTDLKQALKARGLSIVGNKSDLIQRLETALLKDATSNNNQTKNNSSLEKEIDEDAILGGDDDDVGVIVSMDKHDTIIPNEDLLLSETTLDLKSSSSVSLKRTSGNQALNVKPTNENPPNENISSKLNESSNVADSISKNNAKEAVPSLKQLVKDQHSLTPDERKKLRALKFADPKVLKRAERFGIQSKTLEPSPESALLKRAQRFGEVVSTKAKALDEQQRMLKRAERFGTSPSNSTISAPKIQTNTPADEKIMKRQERFGKVEQTKATFGNNNNPIKRRRYAV